MHQILSDCPSFVEDITQNILVFFSDTVYQSINQSIKRDI